MFSGSKEHYTLNVWTRGNSFVFLRVLMFPEQKQRNKDGVWATTTQLYSGQDTFEFDQGQVTKNQPITVLISVSESLAI